MEMLGLYPVWFEPTLGSGWIIGIIATIHVLFSHTSVGAALVFSYLAVVAYRKNRPELLDYIRRYGLFLLVFSYVLGSITGPGIWFSTTVGSPRGISALIHSFVWKWATEWVFFVIEVIGVYMIVYLVNKVDQKTHLRISIIFGLASYTTMLIIIGILSFMLMPGNENWYTEGGYLNGFYGANTFAQLAMRTAFMFTMTAVVGGIVASSIKDIDFRKEMVRRLAILGLVATAAGLGLFKWYLSTIPATAELVMENRLPEYFTPALISVMGGIMAYFAATLAAPKLLKPAIAGVMTVVILVFGLWPEEVARESIRKPYVAGGYVYSNQVIGRDVPGLGIHSEIPTIEEHGFTNALIFLPEELRTVTDSNKEAVGQALALNTCSNCHSLTDTGIRPLTNYFGDDSSESDIAAYLRAALSSGTTLYMPQIPLQQDEAVALASFIRQLKDQSIAVAADQGNPITVSQSH
ncbi:MULTISPECIES: cytochrome ubiquinol oxidase subunit I [unclassified Marinobacterium]|uniref:cytochrome ubiquinol oxidase subunit I n=1 Tax=unclassified Marinobacterium TaxID=2644139 RepID=UPI0015683CC2|nr:MULTISPECIES: cytochrome ubiquinol oxidase subunit I [unclassified Marinobacterium]NRP46715.1 hypothetical protein [Marinobacterium sp. xm-d-543]NRQ23272.1 hypothetical protein [Marinobacterium sp. xm-m-312]